MEQWQRDALDLSFKLQQARLQNETNQLLRDAYGPQIREAEARRAAAAAARSEGRKQWWEERSEGRAKLALSHGPIVRCIVKLRGTLFFAFCVLGFLFIRTHSLAFEAFVAADGNAVAGLNGTQQWDEFNRYIQVDPAAANFWQHAALLCFLLTFLGDFFHYSPAMDKSIWGEDRKEFSYAWTPFAVAGLFSFEAGCMIFFGMPVWVWMLPVVVAISELFSKDGSQTITSGLGVIVAAHAPAYENTRNQYKAVRDQYKAVATWWKSLGDEEPTAGEDQEGFWYVRKAGDARKLRRVTRSELVQAARAGKLKANYEVSRSADGPFRPVAEIRFTNGQYG